MTMKAMSMTFNKKGDDDYFYRLFSYFRLQFHENIMDMVPYRKNVILLKTEENTYMLKGYKSNNRLKLQEAFTATLRNEGFAKTYLYVHPEVNDPLFFEGTYFGCMEYIAPNKSLFTYKTKKNRLEGLELLALFHQVTGKFESRYRTLIPRSDIFEKWKERAELFSKNIPTIKYFLNEAYIKEMLDWASWSLQGMENNSSFFNQEPSVILHGDVAHHNFIRDTKGSLNLIDFDLISIGPPVFDYLQYTNRILPYQDWSFENLMYLPTFEKYLDEKAVLFALAFPADIFREWNRIIRENSYTDYKKLNQIINITIHQFYLRMNFNETLIRRINN